MSDSDAVAALKRAGVRAVYHLLRAGVESLKAVEAVVDELARAGRNAEPDRGGTDRINIDIE